VVVGSGASGIAGSIVDAVSITDSVVVASVVTGVVDEVSASAHAVLSRKEKKVKVKERSRSVGIFDFIKVID
jgi:hypothetical protein